MSREINEIYGLLVAISSITRLHDSERCRVDVEDGLTNIRNYLYEVECQLENAYDEGYEDGANAEAYEHEDCPTKLDLSIMDGSHTFKQVTGWVTHNYTIFGYGDTEANSKLDFIKKAYEVLLWQ